MLKLLRFLFGRTRPANPEVWKHRFDGWNASPTNKEHLDRKILSERWAHIPGRKWWEAT